MKSLTLFLEGVSQDFKITFCVALCLYQLLANTFLKLNSIFGQVFTS